MDIDTHNIAIMDGSARLEGGERTSQNTPSNTGYISQVFIAIRICGIG
jgi:hypothetical protein